jgi:hypothetical protein
VQKVFSSVLDRLSFVLWNFDILDINEIKILHLLKSVGTHGYVCTSDLVETEEMSNTFHVARNPRHHSFSLTKAFSQCRNISQDRFYL